MTKFIVVRRSAIVGLMLASSFAITSCGTADASASTAPVKVIITDFNVGTNLAAHKTGTIDFKIRNTSDVTMHEMLVIKTDLKPEEFPVDPEDGRIDEESAKINFIKETSDIKVRESRNFSLNLEPGHYWLICNLNDHFKKGMHTEFTVTG